jgi:FkbM family methyltransferase
VMDVWFHLSSRLWTEESGIVNAEQSDSGRPIPLVCRKKKKGQSRMKNWYQRWTGLRKRATSVSFESRLALRRALSRSGDLEWVRANDYQLQIRRDDHGTVAEFLRRKGVYEGDVVRLFHRLVRPGDRVLDVGANIGYFTVLLSRLVGPEGRVYAVEPDPRNFALLQRNIAANDCQNVEAFQLALSDRNGIQTLYTDQESSSVHSLARDNVIVQGDCVSVKTCTLDDFAKAHIPDGRVDVMKIDAQGAEGAIFSQGESFLTAGEMTMLLEYWPHGLKSFNTDPEAFLQSCATLGFHFRLLARKTLGAEMDATALWGELSQRQFSQWAAENIVLSRGHGDRCL